MKIVEQNGGVYRVIMVQEELDALCGACCAATQIQDRTEWRVLFDELKIFDTDFNEKKNEKV